MASKKILYPYPELLFQLLVTINMFEGTDQDLVDNPVSRLRDGLAALIHSMRICHDYQTQADVTELDKVFKEAGWDNNGLRWDVDSFGEYYGLHLVEFSNGSHTIWIIA